MIVLKNQKILWKPLLLFMVCIWAGAVTVHCAFENHGIGAIGAVLLHWVVVLLVYIYYKKGLKSDA